MSVVDIVPRVLKGSSLRATALRGTAWTTVGFGLQYMIRLLSTLVLTRLLAPEVFGLMSLASVFMMALSLLSDLGTVPSVIRSPRGDDPEFLRTAWTIQAIRGVGITIVLCLLAWPISRIYDEPVLFPLLCALSVSSSIKGVTSISSATCRRKMQLGRLTLLGLLVQAGTTALNVLAAWYLQNVWALVIGGLLGACLQLFLSYRMLPPFEHRFRLERDALVEIVTFGRWILLATLMTYFAGQGNKALMGFLIPLDTLGLITIATTMSWALGDLVTRVLDTVAFPSLSRISGERPQDFPAAMRKMKIFIFAGTLPVFLALSFLAEPLVGFLYDPRYFEAGGYLALFALNGAISVLCMPYLSALLAKGDSRAHSVIQSCSAVLSVSGLWIGFQLAGVHGMIAGLGAGTMVVLPISAGLSRRYGMVTPWIDIVAATTIVVVYAIRFQAVYFG